MTAPRAVIDRAYSYQGATHWPSGDQWKTGGAPVWVTGNYDPDTNRAFWGTGNGGPTIGDQRPGDNLYTTSTLALDVATGAIKGYFQYHQNDSWDYDEVSPPIIVDYQRNGRTYKGLIDVARDGYLWFLERSSGPIKFVEGKPYVYQNVFRSLDPESGRPDVDPAHKPGTGKRADYCPGTHGGKNWPPIVFSPKTRMIYIPANNNMGSSNMGGQVQYTPGRPFVGVQGSQPFTVPGADHFGEVQAWNVDTGQRVWTHNYPKSPNWGSVLATAGGVIFSGGTIDRKIHAFDGWTEYEKMSGGNWRPNNGHHSAASYTQTSAGNRKAVITCLRQPMTTMSYITVGLVSPFPAPASINRYSGPPNTAKDVSS